MSIANQAKLDRYAREDAAFWTPERIAEQKAAREAGQERDRQARQMAFNALTADVPMEVIATACTLNKVGYEVLETIMESRKHSAKQASAFTRICDRDTADEETVCAAVAIFKIVANKRWGIA